MSTTRRVFLRSACLSAAALMPLAGTARSLARPRVSTGARAGRTYFDWQRIAEDVHAVADLSTGGNVLVLKQSSGALVIDSKFAHLGSALVQDAQKLAGPVRLLINTHHHGDHTGGNVAFSPETRIMAHTKAEPRIKAQHGKYLNQLRTGVSRMDEGDEAHNTAKNAAQGLLTEIDELAAARWAPTELMKGSQQTIQFDSVQLELTHVGQGHTDNDVFIKLAELNVIHTGDLLFHGLHPFFDPAGGYSALGWIKSVQAIIEASDDKTVIVPGHGKITDKSALIAQKNYLQGLVNAVREGIASGQSEDELATQTWDFMQGLGFEQIRERAIRAVYTELSKRR